METIKQTNDTDALRKLCDLANKLCGGADDDLLDELSATLKPARDELDRLRAAEDASKARVEEMTRVRDDWKNWHDMVCRQRDEFARTIVEQKRAVHCEYDEEIWILRRDATGHTHGIRRLDEPARAEIARLTDAGATFVNAVAVVEKRIAKWSEGFGVISSFNPVERDAAKAILRDLEALATEKRR